MPKFRISPVNAYKLKELLFIVLYWIIMVRSIVVLEYFGMNTGDVQMHEAKIFRILRESLPAATLAGLAIGLLTGLSELFFFQK